MKKYHRQEGPPHVFLTASRCYNAVNNGNQAVLISGESGSGKTESTKKVLAFIAKCSVSESNIEDRIMESNPVLEAFGNAATLRNDNSSRFGKWMTMTFSKKKQISGSAIHTYLLEKSRVVHLANGERTYHVFYQLLTALDEESFRYTSRGDRMTIQNVDDEKEYNEMRGAMSGLGWSTEDQQKAMDVVKAILYLGECDFEAATGGPDASRAMNGSSLGVAGPLIGIDDMSKLENALTTRVELMGGKSMVTITLGPNAAADARDALAKALYANLFNWLVAKVNKALKMDDPNDDDVSIGVLDIFGFEVFQKNGFEQLCNNYANEKLQDFFNDVVFQEEKAVYEAEGVDVANVAFVDNSKCVALFDGKPVSLLSLLDDECAAGNAARDDKFRSQGAVLGKKNEHFILDRKVDATYGFAVQHFAGRVDYDACGFVDTNRDAISATLGTLFALHSTNSMVTQFFAENEDNSSSRGQRKKKLKTIGSEFRSQLASLTTTLGQATPHFIRCIKSNAKKKPKIFESPLCLMQLRYSGLFEVVAARQAGYACRIDHTTFLEKYAIIVPGCRRREDDARSQCEAIVNSAQVRTVLDIKKVVVGTKSKVFLKESAMQTALERLRRDAAKSGLIRGQALWRGYRLRISAVAGVTRKQRQQAARELQARRTLQSWVRGCVARKKTRGLRETIRRFRKLDTPSSNREAILDEVLLPLLGGPGKADLAAAFGKTNLRDATRKLLHQEELSIDLVASLNFLPSHLAKKVHEAATELLRIRSKDAVLRHLDRAVETKDLSKLQSLLGTAKGLGLDVTKAQGQYDRLVKTKTSLDTLKRFLDESDDERATSMDDVEAALKEVQEVDRNLADVAGEKYRRLKPTLDARRALRRAVERIDGRALDTALDDLLAAAPEAVGWPEAVAARAAKRMLDLERDLDPTTDDGPRFDDTLLELCDRLKAALTKEQRAKAETALRHACTGSEFDRVKRAYKWRSLFCTWLSTGHTVFCGMRLTDAQRTYRHGISSSSSGIWKKQPPSPPPADTPAPPPPIPARIPAAARRSPAKEYAGIDPATRRRLEASRLAVRKGRDKLLATYRDMANLDPIPGTHPWRPP